MYPWEECRPSHKPSLQLEKSLLKQRQASSKKLSVHSERALIEQMEKMIIEFDEEIKHLNPTLAKLAQKERNKTLFYETRIVELEQRNEELRMWLEGNQGDKMRSSRDQQQGRGGRLSMQPSYKGMENNQNVNKLNTQFQPCSNPRCAMQAKKIKGECEQIAKVIEDLLHFEHRDRKQFEEWSRKMQVQKARRTSDDNKSLMFLLKRIQLSLDELERSLCHQNESKQLPGPLMKAMSGIKAKQASLIRIPFLERINLQERREEYANLLESCRSIQKGLVRLMSMEV